MKAIIQSVAVIIIGFQMMNASKVLAEEAKVSKNVTQEVAEAEKLPPDQEKTEEGEASGNVEDCEPSNDSVDARDGVDKKNLDECEAMVK